MKLSKNDPNIAWRAKYIRNIRATQDRNLQSDKGLGDDYIFRKAKQEIPPVFTTSHLFSKIITRKRSATDRSVITANFKLTTHTL